MLFKERSYVHGVRLNLKIFAREEGGRVVQATFRHDMLFLLKQEGRYITLLTEADRSSERSKVGESQSQSVLPFLASGAGEGTTR